MRIAYFDCFSGISGDMTLGAFIDAGLSIKDLRRELGKIAIGGFRISAKKVARGALVGTKFDCAAIRKTHAHRPLSSIFRLIDRSRLSRRAKERSREIYAVIGHAEAKMHGYKGLDKVHLHELGQMDSIIDIIGTAVACDLMNIDEIYASRLVMARGSVQTMAGRLPLPSPAALELIRGVPVSIADDELELVTPTGAGILKALSRSFGPMPEMKVERIGYGAGAKDRASIPNMLRVIIGETTDMDMTDRVCVIETNIDDMNPQIFGHVSERLLREGALDVYLTPIQMKKMRPAIELTVICREADKTRLVDIIFAETTTIGLRTHIADRVKLKRKISSVSTRFGKVRVKVSESASGARTVSPEHDDCLRLARKSGAALRDIYDMARMRAMRERESI